MELALIAKDDIDRMYTNNIHSAISRIAELRQELDETMDYLTAMRAKKFHLTGEHI